MHWTRTTLAWDRYAFTNQHPLLTTAKFFVVLVTAPLTAILDYVPLKETIDHTFIRQSSCVNYSINVHHHLQCIYNLACNFCRILYSCFSNCRFKTVEMTKSSSVYSRRQYQRFECSCLNSTSFMKTKQLYNSHTGWLPPVNCDSMLNQLRKHHFDKTLLQGKQCIARCKLYIFFRNCFSRCTWYTLRERNRLCWMVLCWETHKETMKHSFWCETTWVRNLAIIYFVQHSDNTIVLKVREMVSEMPIGIINYAVSNLVTWALIYFKKDCVKISDLEVFADDL